MKYTEIKNYKVVPEEIKQIVTDECAAWDNTFGYGGKNYSANKEFQFQLDINASFSEDQTMSLITNPSIISEVNELLYKNNITTRIADGYVFNDKKHGEIYVGLDRVDERTWCDFVRTGGKFDPNAAWTIETKSTKSKAKAPSGFHKADIVFVFYLDTKEIKVLAPTVERKNRTDQDYVVCGTISEEINFDPVTIKKNTWEIIY